MHPEDYINRWSTSHRAPRLFRNIWYYDKDDFDYFQELLEETWPGMTVVLPELYGNQLNMFCLENRMTREVFWAGYGFQIWLQLLTHLVKSSDADLIVVDEPEIYLHPDLQRKVIYVLKDLGPRIILATHSVEIINEVDPEDVLMVDKSNTSAKRLSTTVGLQKAIDLLGSTQNIQLARLARGKRILFVEGKDYKLLSRLSAIAGNPALFETGEITPIPIEGFTQWERILHAQWAFEGVLGEGLKVMALFDRDFRCQKEVNQFIKRMKSKVAYIHVLEKNEIENYILVPSAIDKAIGRQLKSRQQWGKLEKIPDYDINSILEELTDEFREYVYGQIVSNYFRFNKSTGVDLATVAASLLKDFDESWNDLNIRLALVPGKDLLSKLNDYIQERWGISITSSLIISCMKSTDIDYDLMNFFKELDDFKSS